MRGPTGEEWICRVCWKPNRAQDASCYKCRSPRGVTPEEAAEAAKDIEARRALPEPVPDWVLALPVAIFRSYGRVWVRGAIGLLGVLALELFAAVTDLDWYVLTVGFAAGLLVAGLLAAEVSEGMRNREVWSFVVGIALSVVAVIGSITSFSIFAPDLLSPNAIRWGSVVVFGGAGVAAVAGLALVLTRRDTSGADARIDAD
ncbi:MAG TPA: hypothetical protein VL687_08535 [Methylomirabilota bacterium]|nr:hypothetical protein [Methylomirabilota bacterium]